MICVYCHSDTVTWRGPLVALTHTQCSRCGRINCQKAHPEDRCERCQGNGEIVTDWDRYLHPHKGDAGDEAVEECPDCGGRGHA